MKTEIRWRMFDFCRWYSCAMRGQVEIVIIVLIIKEDEGDSKFSSCPQKPNDEREKRVGRIYVGIVVGGETGKWCEKRGRKIEHGFLMGSYISGHDIAPSATGDDAVDAVPPTYFFFIFFILRLLLPTQPNFFYRHNRPPLFIPTCSKFSLTFY